jgi:hypothetical protein
VSKTPGSPPLIAIFLLSAVALAYEILLVRMFQIIHWHHFAFMIISLALLGYGISGSLITLFRSFSLRHYSTLFFVNLLLFGAGSILVFLVVQQIPFNALEILWDSSQWLRLFVTYLLLSLPFLFVANAIALTMLRFDRQIGAIYGADLIGAGAGAILLILLLDRFEPEQLLRILALAGLAAGIPVLLRPGGRSIKAALLAIAALLVGLLPQAWLEPKLSEYKGLEQVLLIEGAEQVERRSSAMSRVDVVRSPLIPFRHAPGLSLQTPAGPPAQLGVFVDGDAMSVIDEASDPASTGYMRWMSSSLPWETGRTFDSVLVLNAGTGADVRQAALSAGSRIDAIEPDGQLAGLLAESLSFDGGSLSSESVSIHETSARAWAASTDRKYDLVVMGVPGASTGAAAGVFSFAADFDLTVEAIGDYLKLLKPGGYLSITLWTDTPPKGNLRLFATVIDALRQAGIANPGERMAWIRSWNTATLLVRHGELTPGEVARIRDFARSRGFDMAWLPGIQASEVNRYQLLPRAYFYEAATALLGDDAAAFISGYQYDIEPTGDTAPYFGDHFRWQSLRQFLALPGRAGIGLIDAGYPTLIASLLQALAAGLALILVPLLFLGKATAVSGNRVRVLLYFTAIGLAFLFMELSFIEILTLIIGQPLYAVAITLSVFLLFSGLGSLAVQWLVGNGGVDAGVMLRWSVIGILLIGGLYVLLHAPLTDWLMRLPEQWRIAATVLSCAPLAFVMGMPFPIGLTATSQSEPDLLPWAWGINGCASVLSAILAVLLAMEIGFDGVMLCAMALYLVAWRSLPSLRAT